jgi:hypothetical protein
VTLPRAVSGHGNTGWRASERNQDAAAAGRGTVTDVYTAARLRGSDQSEGVL